MCLAGILGEGVSISQCTMYSMHYRVGWTSVENFLPVLQPTFRLARLSKTIRAAKKGFGPQREKKYQKGDRAVPIKDDIDPLQQARELLDRKQSAAEGTEALDGNKSVPVLNDDKEFQKRLAALRSSLPTPKKEEDKMYAAIDYDEPAPAKSESSGSWTDSTAAKVGIGVGAGLFALLFAFGDLLPSGLPPNQSASVSQLSETEKKKFQDDAEKFEATLKTAPANIEALEGAAVSYAELGDYAKSASYLQSLVKIAPADVDALRLLGEVRLLSGQFGSAAQAYRQAVRASPKDNIELLQGLADSLVGDGKPEEAIGEIRAAKARMKSQPPEEGVASIDPVQVELLLAKVYGAWKKQGDAVAIYDQLITAHPEDFRGYLAKGLLMKDQGNSGEAERMLIQARFFAPTEAKSLVDRLASRPPRTPSK